MKDKLKELIEWMEDTLLKVNGDNQYQLGYKDSIRDCVIRAYQIQSEQEEAANLVSKEDALGFAEFLGDCADKSYNDNTWFYSLNEKYPNWYTTEQMFEIYLKQKP